MTKYYVVVYQFGKVASTSIVEAFDGLDDVTAVQTHFLGKKAFLGIIDALINPLESEYFTKHREGQLLRNIEIMRRINAHKLGLLEESKLALISLSREPMAWFRSSLSQDIVGHLPNFKKMLSNARVSFDDDSGAIKVALPVLFDRITTAIQLAGCIDTFFANDPDFLFANVLDSRTEILKFTDEQEIREFKKFLALFLRPFGWFDHHFKDFLGVDLRDMRSIGDNIVKKDLGWCSTYILRYEDIEMSIPIIAKDIGISGDMFLERKNVSAKKKFADAINSGFESDEARILQASCRSRYTQRFGYTAFCRPYRSDRTYAPGPDREEAP